MLSYTLNEVTYPQRLRNLKGPCMGKNTYIDVHEPSEDDYRLFIAKIDNMFLIASGRRICDTERNTNMSSAYKAL